MLRTYSCTAADTVKTDSIAAALNFLPKNWKREEYQVLEDILFSVCLFQLFILNLS